MGDFLVIGFIAILFTLIGYSMIRSLKTKGTLCTSCKSCPLANKDKIKNEMLQLIRE